MTALLTATDGLLPGFADPVFDSQRVFRTVLDAFAHPGSVHEFAPLAPTQKPLAPASAAYCLALLDFETALWLQPGLPAAQAEWIARHLHFHCGCPFVSEPLQARFALIHDVLAMPALASFHPGEIDYPDRSATLIVQVASLDAGAGHAVKLRGPGIRESTKLSVAGLPGDFWQQWRENGQLFPCGVDLVFVAGKRIACLPRTILVES